MFFEWQKLDTKNYIQKFEEIILGSIIMEVYF